MATDIHEPDEPWRSDNDPQLSPSNRLYAQLSEDATPSGRAGLSRVDEQRAAEPS